MSFTRGHFYRARLALIPSRMGFRSDLHQALQGHLGAVGDAGLDVFLSSPGVGLEDLLGRAAGRQLMENERDPDASLPLQSVLLFGSHCRGEAQADSDVDIVPGGRGRRAPAGCRPALSGGIAGDLAVPGVHAAA